MSTSDAAQGSTEEEVFQQRLLNVAKALRESPDPSSFSMRWFTHSDHTGHPCGTPMCALGHYASRRDLQQAFFIDEAGLMQATEKLDEDGDRMEIARIHFGLSEPELDHLFEIKGCGNARTNIEAARFIERFVAKKYPEPTILRTTYP